jgi:hypothetical protein
MRSRSLLVCAAVLGGLWAAEPASAQATFAPADSVTVVPAAQFKAGGLHRFFFGTRYRKLWTTPIKIPVLRLGQFAGGLTPIERGGGMQTKSLRFKGGDGKQYQFRSLAKDPASVLPPELRNTVAADILRDQTSAQHPAGMVAVGPLLDAAGVLNAKPILVQLADDPALGQFRTEFAGMVGTIEERPTDSDNPAASFAGADKVESTADMIKAVNEEPTVTVDGPAFLLARLTDVFVGDWDRHQDQWRWARVHSGGRARWLPIPRDRDQVFVIYDGFLPGVARRVNPQIIRFERDYAEMVGATWNGRDLDRRFLTGLERPVWDSVAAVLKSRLTDAAISAAVAAMPPEFRPLDGPNFERTLRSRRDKLTGMAEKYYEFLAGVVDVYGSEKADEARVQRQDNGRTMVTLSHNGTEYFRRTFDNGETGSVRLYLQGGPDKVTVEGDGSSSPVVRVIGQGGDDQYTITERGGVKLYDDKGSNTAVGAGINTKEWKWKPDSARPNELPPRDWGARTMRLMTGYFATDLGAVIQYGGFNDWYGFRHVPYSTRLSYQLQYSTAKQSGRFIGGITRQFENSQGFYHIDLLASGIETLRWYGLGNETEQTESKTFYKLNQNEFGVGLRFGSRFGRNDLWRIGPEVRWSQTKLDTEPNSERFIAEDRPYGTGDFGMVGLTAELRVDGRDFPGFAAKGVYLSIKASGYPKAWDVDETFGRISGEAGLALAPRGSWQPSLHLMVGGIKTFGDSIPFFETARLGGLRTLRGYNFDRFAGHAAAYGSAELRLPLTRIKFVVPGQQGVFGFYDAGRVWIDGEDSDEIHTAFGGGFWMSFLNRGTVAYVGVARPTKDKEGNRVLAGFGFPF